jgi:hypothetical protein
MPSASQSGSTYVPSSDARVALPRKSEDLTYQAMTVAAMVLLLASLWIF